MSVTSSPSAPVTTITGASVAASSVMAASAISLTSSFTTSGVVIPEQLSSSSSSFTKEDKVRDGGSSFLPTTEEAQDSNGVSIGVSIGVSLVMSLRPLANFSSSFISSSAVLAPTTAASAGMLELLLLLADSWREKMRASPQGEVVMNRWNSRPSFSLKQETELIEQNS